MKATLKEIVINGGNEGVAEEKNKIMMTNNGIICQKESVMKGENKIMNAKYDIVRQKMNGHQKSELNNQ